MDDALRWKPSLNQQWEQTTESRTNTTARFGGGDDEPVLIAVLHGPLAPEMAQDALTEAGIPVFIKRNTMGALYGLTLGAWGSAEVWVPPALAQRAYDILAGLDLLGLAGSE